jgi:hypothetical protein
LAIFAHFWWFSPIFGYIRPFWAIFAHFWRFSFFIIFIDYGLIVKQTVFFVKERLLVRQIFGQIYFLSRNLGPKKLRCESGPRSSGN